jgi:hypothetical protein
MPGLTLQHSWNICNQSIVPQISYVEGVSGEDFDVVLVWYPHQNGLGPPINSLCSKIWDRVKRSKMTSPKIKTPKPWNYNGRPRTKILRLYNLGLYRSISLPSITFLGRTSRGGGEMYHHHMAQSIWIHCYWGWVDENGKQFLIGSNAEITGFHSCRNYNVSLYIWRVAIDILSGMAKRCWTF